ncbi:retrovirus-related pol polyprotein from transposon TNT 1-94 [Tanacetum coccineum]
MESSSLKSEVKKLQQMKQEERKFHSKCMGRIKILKSHLTFQNAELNNGFQRAVKTYLGEEYDTFTQKIIRFKKFFDSKEVNASDRKNRFLKKYFKDITRADPQTFRVRLLRYLDELDKLIDERAREILEGSPHEMASKVLEKDSEASKVKKEKYKSLALKSRKLSSDEEESCSISDEEHAMAIRDFMKLFRRRGKFVRQPHDDKKSDEEDESKRDEICLMALDNNEVLLDIPYYSSSSLDSESLQNEYNKLCNISLRIINKNKHLKDKNELLNEACALRKRLDQLERNKEVSVECESCVDLDHFEILSKKIQVQKGCPIVSIRTDHGREFDNEVQFGAFCDANGITYNFLAPRTPQSNRVVERKNRTLQEMSRTLLNEQSIPIFFAVMSSTHPRIS